MKFLSSLFVLVWCLAASPATAKPLLMLWGHKPSHCIQGVAPELCTIAQTSEWPDTVKALAKLRASEAKYEADPQQRPVYRGLRYLALQQSRMNANGSGAVDAADDPGNKLLTQRQNLAIQAFQEAPYETLPYLPIPLLKVFSELSHRDQARHRKITDEMIEATFKMRTPLDHEAASLLYLLASHRGMYDAPAAAALYARSRAALGTSPNEISWKIQLLLGEASMRSAEHNWDAFPTHEFGIDHLVQALVLMHRTPKLTAEDFRAHYTTAVRTLKLKRTWIKKKNRWNSEIQAQAWQADAMLALLKLVRPKDAVIQED